jgi:hypothetical protein
MTPTNFIILMISFGCVCAVGFRLYDGYKIDLKRKQEELTKSFNREKNNGQR